MKQMSLSIVVVLLLALALGFGFRWLYPQVEIGPELAGLFVFVALAVRLLGGWLWSLRGDGAATGSAPPRLKVKARAKRGARP
jgi:hypothetical protein